MTVKLSLSLDVEGFKKFGKKSITCKKEQVAQLCWNGNTNDPIVVQGMRGGGKSSCQIQQREGLSCFEHGMIPIGSVHTHPPAKVVTLDPTNISIEHEEKTAFSPSDILTSVQTNQGMVSSYLVCLASETNTSCIATEDVPKRDVSDLRGNIQHWKMRIRSITSAYRHRGKNDSDEIAKLNKEINDIGIDARESAKKIIDESETIIFSHDDVDLPSITLSSDKICNIVNRYKDNIDKWKKSQLIKKYAEMDPNEYKSTDIKKSIKHAKNCTEYIKNEGSINKFMKNVGKC